MSDILEAWFWIAILVWIFSDLGVIDSLLWPVLLYQRAKQLLK